MPTQKHAKQAATRERHLSTEFLSDLKCGSLSGLLSILRTDKTLLLCSRGGLGHEYINVYYRGHSLFKVVRDTSCRVSFNFNHARYTKDWQLRLDSLRALGYKLNHDNTVKLPFSGKNKNGRAIVVNPPNDLSFVVPGNGAPQAFWANSVMFLKGLIDDFFAPALGEDYFKKQAGVRQSKKTKSPLIEKQDQQQIMLTNNSLADEYFVFDMEYDQARNSKEEAKSGRFDMLALRQMPSGLRALVFIELKSTKSACTGESGLDKHYKDLKGYIENKEYVKTRKKDAVKICRQYCDLFNLVMPEMHIAAAAELLFVFTGAATVYAKEIPAEQSLIPISFKLRYPPLQQ